MHKMLRIDGKFRKFVRSKALNNILVSFLAFLAAATGAVRFWTHAADHWLTVPLILVAFAILLLNAAKFLIERDDEKRSESTEPLMVVLHSLFSILENGDQIDHGLRLCVFIKDKDKDKIVQLTDYVGGTGGAKGRSFSIRSGIVGDAFRCAKPKVAVASLPQNRQLVDFLVAEFRYTHEEAMQRTHDRMAWAAAPIGIAGNIIAVIYCDSKIRGFFGKSTSFRRKALAGSILGIAKYLHD